MLSANSGGGQSAAIRDAHPAIHARNQRNDVKKPFMKSFSARAWLGYPRMAVQVLLAFVTSQG